MKFKKYNELFLGIIILAIGIIYLLLTGTIPKKNVANAIINAASLPIVLSVFLIILGICQIIVGIMKVKVSDETVKEDTSEEKVNYSTVIWVIIVIVVYVALLSKIGFLIMTFLCLVSLFILLTPSGMKKRYILYIVIAALSTIIIYIAFRFGLHLMLPEGIFR